LSCLKNRKPTKYRPDYQQFKKSKFFIVDNEGIKTFLQNPSDFHFFLPFFSTNFVILT